MSCFQSLLHSLWYIRPVEPYFDVDTKVGFEDLEYPVVEGENTTVCITFDKKLEKDITVKYSLESSTEGNSCQVVA